MQYKTQIKIQVDPILVIQFLLLTQYRYENDVLTLTYFSNRYDASLFISKVIDLIGYWEEDPERHNPDIETKLLSVTVKAES